MCCKATPSFGATPGPDPDRRPVARGTVARLAAVALLAPALLLAACGKKGDPEPPLRTSPQKTSQLTVAQRGDELLLTLPYPTTTAAGQALKGIEEVVVYQLTRPVPASERELLEPGDETASMAAVAAPEGERTEEDEPAEPDDTDFYAETGIRAADEVDEMEADREVAREMTEAGEEADADEAGAQEAGEGEAGDAAGAADDDEDGYVPPSREQRFRQLIEPLDRRQFETGAQVLATVAGDDLTEAVTGGEIGLRVPLPRPLPDEPQILYLAVRTVGPTDEASDLSNQAVLVALPAPPPPRGLEAEGTADGIRVEWQPQGEVVGYNLYRRNVRSRVFDVPVAVPTADRTDYLDRTAELGETYVYAVTAVARRAPLVESAVAQVQEVDYRDVFPPPVPRNLVALAEEGRVRVVWEGSEADDLAGYHVSRRAGESDGETGGYVDLTSEPRRGTEYADTDVIAGVTYTYRVRAVDEAGNASEGAEASTEAR